MMFGRPRFITALCALPMLAGCTQTVATPSTQGCPLPGMHAALDIRLMFGLTRPNGSAISDAAWDDFMARVSTPLFPDGLTILHSDGQWRDRESGQVTKEPSRIVWINAPLTGDLQGRLNTIRQAYRTRFAQQAVGLVITSGCEDF